MRLIPACMLLLVPFASHAQWTVESPDKKIAVSLSMADSGKIQYSVKAGNTEVLRPSALGLMRSDGDFSKGFSLLKAEPVKTVEDKYEMVFAKRRNNHYKANKAVFHLKNGVGKMDVIFQVSNDGIAFRYYFPDAPTQSATLTQELTSYHFPLAAKGFLQPMQVAKTGWKQSNPAYEEHYSQDLPVGTASTLGAGWVYPALFQSNENWVLITEAGVDTNDCATRLESASPDGEYKIGYPDPREIFTGRGLLPQVRASYYTPWRVVVIGSLATIMESTLGTDVAKPAVLKYLSYIQPGAASWSWINSKDNYIIYREQKKYVDFAAAMSWPYCLVDADWDRKIGYDSIKILAQYAASKNVGLLLWYNSAGDWNTVPYTPKNKLLNHEERMAEFKRIQEMGIKGVKIDFFGGDGQSMMAYYIAILKDAAACKLMVNFHGATLPRGWARTYPNLVTTEAVKGFEMVTFEQKDADKEANHCAMLPFARNAFDPMDFTPMNLHRIQSKVQRKTTSGFELALSVVFLSGIQHYAESPEGMEHVPGYVQDFLRRLPGSWDDVKFIDGYPGKYLVVARKWKNKWYIAGINAEASEKNISLNLSSYKCRRATLITDGTTPLSFAQKELNIATSQSITMQPSGGFVIEAE